MPNYVLNLKGINILDFQRLKLPYFLLEQFRYKKTLIAVLALVFLGGYTKNDEAEVQITSFEGIVILDETNGPLSKGRIQIMGTDI